MCVVGLVLVGEGRGIAPIGSWHVSQQKMKGGKANRKREKDEEGTQRTLVDRRTNKTFFFFFFSLDVYLNMALKRRRSLWDLRVGSNKVKMWSKPPR